MDEIAIALAGLVVAYLLVEHLTFGRRRRREVEAQRFLSSAHPTWIGHGRHCVRCGGEIASADLVVAGPPSARGPELAHYECPLVPVRPKGLPGDKRWQASYDRDARRLRALFQRN